MRFSFFEAPDRPVLPRNRLVAVLGCLCTLWPAAAYAFLGDAPLITVLTVLALLPPLFMSKSVQISGRSVIYTLTAAAIITTLLNQAYPVDSDRFFMPLPTEIVVPLLLVIMVGLLYLEQTSSVLTALIILSLIAFLMQGTCLNDPTNNQRLILEPGLWRNRKWIYGFFASLQLLALLPLIHFAAPRRQVVRLTDRSTWRRRSAYLISSVVMVAMTVGFCVTADKTFHKVERWMSPFFSHYERRSPGLPLFGQDVDLRQTVDFRSPKYAQKIVFRARANQPPGYMRGRVYLDYQDFTWYGLAPEEPLTAIPPEDPALAFKRYSVNNRPSIPLEAMRQRIDVFPTENYTTHVAFAPGGTQVIEVIGSRLTHHEDGIFQIDRSWERKGGLTLYSEKFDQMEAWQEPKVTPENLAAYLKVPADSAEAYRALAATIMPDSDIPVEQKTHMVISWLQARCSYSLGVQMDPERDPVLQFINEKHKGHCELFASAAAMLLRSRGVPCRYVTGFVCFESHPLQHMWIARLKDAHAWVEAWDDETGRWVIVESTPATGVPTGTDETGWLADAKEQLLSRWESVYMLIKRGYFAEAVLDFLRNAGSLLSWLFWHGPWYAAWPLTLLAAYYLVVRYRRRRKGSAVTRSAFREEMENILRQIELYVAPLQVRRTPSTTIADLIQQVRTCGAQETRVVVPLLEEYQALRFSPDHPDETAVQMFKARVTEKLGV